MKFTRWIKRFSQLSAQWCEEIQIFKIRTGDVRPQVGGGRNIPTKPVSECPLTARPGAGTCAGQASHGGPGEPVFRNPALRLDQTGNPARFQVCSVVCVASPSRQEIRVWHNLNGSHGHLDCGHLPVLGWLWQVGWVATHVEAIRPLMRASDQTWTGPSLLLTCHGPKSRPSARSSFCH